MTVRIGLILISIAVCALISQSISRAPDEPSDQPHGPNVVTDHPPIFEDISQDIGVDFVWNPGANVPYDFPAIMGGGCALFDFDQDGDPDIYLVNGGGRLETNRSESPESVRNQLYRREPDGTYTDVSGASGLDDAESGMGVVAGDINNDGLPDVYVSNFGPDRQRGRRRCLH